MKRPARTLAAGCLAAVCFLALPGCESQTTTVDSAPVPGEAVTPRVAVEAPTDLHDIAGFLLRYRAAHPAHGLPESLAALRAEGIMPADGYPGLDDYAYRPTGLGTLADGRAVLVVDTAIRVEGHAWCILAEPSRNPRAATLAVTLVPMAQLRAARP